jgi:hypothetical protein
MEGRVPSMKTLLSAPGRMLAIFYAIIGILFFCYSYTQVDLGLTLSQTSVLLRVQQWFQHIGYFERPLSTALFLGIVLVLFLLYATSLVLAYQKKFSARDVWVLVAVTTITTCLAYPAFSYDFFNYLFTAKTVLIYHKNPYDVIPLQFTGVDSWLSFMHWTHLPSAYTPFWIVVTLVPFIFGFGYFLPLLWNLKIVIAIAYIATAVGIGKILEHVDKERKLIGIVAFALNPLIIVECLVSPHNDIVMMALAVWAIVLYQKKKPWISWILLSLSIAMKLMTIFLIPAFFMGWKRRVALSCIVVGFITVLFQRDVLSWYWVWVMPFIALVPDLVPVMVLGGGISLGLLLRYAPFLYYGNWNDPVPMIEKWVTWIPIVAALVISLGVMVKNRRISSKTSV